MSSVPGLGRSLGEGYGKTLPYSCLANSMNKEAWHAMVSRVAKQLDMAEGQTLNYFTVHMKDCKSTILQKKKFSHIQHDRV